MWDRRGPQRHSTVEECLDLSGTEKRAGIASEAALGSRLPVKQCAQDLDSSQRMLQRSSSFRPLLLRPLLESVPAGLHSAGSKDNKSTATSSSLKRASSFWLFRSKAPREPLASANVSYSPTRRSRVGRLGAAKLQDGRPAFLHLNGWRAWGLTKSISHTAVVLAKGNSGSALCIGSRSKAK